VKTKDEVIRDRDDREMLLHPEYWPETGVICVKRRLRTEKPGEWPELGVIHERAPTTVIIANLYDILDNAEVMKTAKRHVYDSVDAMLADGWIVD
jgi:hypothetical protein